MAARSTPVGHTADASEVELFRPFFAALAADELRFPCCEQCGRFHWYPKVWCPYCQSPGLTWKRVQGDGTLFSWTTVHRAFSHEFEADVPYTLGLVEFSDAPGVRLLARLMLGSGETPSCGMAVTLELPGDRAPQLVSFRSA